MAKTIESETKINRAIGKVADWVDQHKIPFTFDSERVKQIRQTGEQPFLEAFERMHPIEKSRIEEGIQVLTFWPGRKYGFKTTDFGRGLSLTLATTT